MATITFSEKNRFSLPPTNQIHFKDSVKELLERGLGQRGTPIYHKWLTLDDFNQTSIRNKITEEGFEIGRGRSIEFVGHSFDGGNITFKGTNVSTKIYSTESGNYLNILQETTDGTDFQGIFILFSPTAKEMSPVIHNEMNLGDSSNRWNEIFAHNVLNVADYYFLDYRKDDTGKIVAIDDVSVIEKIKPSEEYDKNGMPIINDDTLPEWLIHKKNGETVYDPEGKPYLSQTMMTSLLMGAIRQLNKRIKILEGEYARKEIPSGSGGTTPTEPSAPDVN